MTQVPDQNQQQQICDIAKAFLSHIAELESTLEVMQASYNQTINQSNLSTREKDVLKHLCTKVAPTGLRSLLEAIRLTSDRTRLLYVDSYKQAAAALSNTIYQQSGVAGPSGERTFTCKADGDRARDREQCHTQPEIKQRVVEPITTTPVLATVVSSVKPRSKAPAPTSGLNKYKYYLDQCPLLQCLGKTPEEPPSGVHLWVQTCGYEMDSKVSAKASLDHGLDALLWPHHEDMNTVRTVHVMPHPSGAGQVFILTMTKPTIGKEINHLRVGTTWCPAEYPMSIIVEVSNRASRECPFSKRRRGWESIEQYLQETNHEQQAINTSSKPRSGALSKHNIETI